MQNLTRFRRYKKLLKLLSDSSMRIPTPPAEQPSAGHFYARNAKKHPAKMQGAFVAGALGLEPRAYGFGDRRSTN